MKKSPGRAPARTERNPLLKQILANSEIRRAAEALAPGKVVRIGGVWGSASALVAGALGRITGRTVLFVTSYLDDADALADDIELFTRRPVQTFPAWELEVAAEHISDEVVGERLRVCTLLAEPPEQRDEPVEFIVAPVMALLQPVPTPEALAASRLALRRGEDLPPESLAAWLVDMGFERVDQVDQPNEFARRGGIVDVLAAGAGKAVRIEFFGDTIESIRLFDLDTQRSTEQIDGFDLAGTAVGRDTDPARTTHLAAYLPEDAIFCMVEPEEVRELARDLYRRIEADRRDARCPELSAGLFHPRDAFKSLEKLAGVEMYAFRPKGQDVLDLGVRSLQKLALNTREALAELAELSEVADVWVYCENAAERDRFTELLAVSQPRLAAEARTEIGHVRSGFHWPAQHLVAVGHHEIFHRYAKVRRIRRVRTGRPIDSLLDLSEGDYVVHVAHGIARFDGLRHLKRDRVAEEYLSLRFANNAVLHVPASRIDLVQKYVGSGRGRPTLSRLGGRMWSRQKKRVEEAVRDLAAEMLRTQAVRQAVRGTSYPADTDWQRKFSQEFLYSETEDQIASMRQIDADLTSRRPMDRLICGDVGYGKTELAMRAAFKVAEAGRQVGVLVPTTILADQHYRTFRERFADYPFEIDAISRFRTAGDQAEILKRLADGRLDILIGTHRMLSDDVRFADLGLVIIDEEQRFGVEHKERLKTMRTTVDVLTLTATPIPRTLHMALLGLRDISSLTTPPLDRRAIYTEVCHYDDGLIRRAIRRELARGGQVFFVHNRVYNIESVADHVRSLVPEARVDVGHGQMPEREMERAMLHFVRRETDVLVCTTIIQSGLDIPTVNTMVVRDADRFGLAELHQLRGRVGRYKHRAYCYLLLPMTRPVSPTAAKRLKAIEEFSDLGAGFQIAMRDLEIRGAGNILGREQSGHIAVVGYELYCRLLENVVRDLRGDKEPLRARPAVHVELGVDTYIPRSYIPSQRQRMEIYRRLASCGGVKDLRQLQRDLADAYGPVPDEVDVLLDVAEIRVLAGRSGIESIILMAPDLIFRVRDLRAVEPVFAKAAGSVRMPDDRTVHWRLSEAYREMPTLVRVLLKRLRQGGQEV